MVHQRQIPERELFCAQLEMLMQHGRVSTMVANLIGMLAFLLLLWPYFETIDLFLWGVAFFTLLLFRSWQMRSALASHVYRERPRGMFWWMVLGSTVTGAAWSTSFIYASASVPPTLEYVLLLVIVVITAVSLALMAMVREYFLAFVFSALWPIAWWSLVYPWDNPYALLIGLLLLGVSALLVIASSDLYDMFRAFISLSWQQEAMSRELGQITTSLRDRNRQLREARQQLTDLANIDELTGLGNRRVVNSVLRAEVNRARRSGSPLSVVLIDVDYFKNYNDTYGHLAGDDVLRRLGDLMQTVTARAGEVVARYGGEEFLFILPNTEEADALRTAQRLQQLVREENIPHSSSDVSDRITVSQGIASVYPAEDTGPGAIIDLADTALYRAKHEGRDRVSVA